tara:strand:- start:523 stop:1080 length:558 start_codon:yes stop_codon:yes gene_type:complete
MTIPVQWLKENRHSPNLATLFTWRRGFFGFKLKGEIKAAKTAHSVLEQECVRMDEEVAEVRLELQDIEEELAKIFDGNEDSKDARASDLTLERERQTEAHRNMQTNLDNRKEDRDIRWNDLKLLEGYSNGVYRIPEDYTSEREAGILATAASKRARYREPEAVKNPGSSQKKIADDSGAVEQADE